MNRFCCTDLNKRKCFLLVLCVCFVFLLMTMLLKDNRFNRLEYWNVRLPETTTVLSKGNNLTRDKLSQKVRVLCWILTHPKNHDTKAKAVKETWARRCNIHLFMSTKEDNSLPTVALQVQEHYTYLWGKTKAAFKYVYEHYLNDADWFLKADDDTYIIVENLRYLLHNYSYDDAIWFGYRFRKVVKRGYFSGGAGYVLSKEALRRFVVEALPNSSLCKIDPTGAEDAEMGKCLENVGVVPMDSRDEFGRGRFFPFIPEHHLSRNFDKNFWFYDYSYYPIRQGRDCCSNLAISFHYIEPQDMKLLDYLIYNLRPFGVNFSSRQDPWLVNLTDVYDNRIIENETSSKEA